LVFLLRLRELLAFSLDPLSFRCDFLSFLGVVGAHEKEIFKFFRDAVLLAFVFDVLAVILRIVFIKVRGVVVGIFVVGVSLIGEFGGGIGVHVLFRDQIVRVFGGHLVLKIGRDCPVECPAAA